jgi:predicted RNA methylase
MSAPKRTLGRALSRRSQFGVVRVLVLEAYHVVGCEQDDEHAAALQDRFENVADEDVDLVTGSLGPCRG